MPPVERVVGVVLAAGRATRFGSNKILAPLDGRPLLQHVVDQLAAGGIEELVVVLPSNTQDVDGAMRWPERVTRVVNPAPERGLSSSVAIGTQRALAGDRIPDALLIALGDQPRVSPEVIRALLATDPSAAVVVPRYPDGTNPNPVVIRRVAYPLLDDVTGDRGLGPVLARHAELVLEVPVAASNPDVDTPGDLAALADAAPNAAVRHPVG